MISHRRFLSDPSSLSRREGLPPFLASTGRVRARGGELSTERVRFCPASLMPPPTQRASFGFLHGLVCRKDRGATTTRPTARFRGTDQAPPPPRAPLLGLPEVLEATPAGLQPWVLSPQRPLRRPRETVPGHPVRLPEPGPAESAAPGLPRESLRPAQGEFRCMPQSSWCPKS